MSLDASVVRGADLNRDGYDDLFIGEGGRISVYAGSAAGLAAAPAYRFSTRDPVSDFVLLDTNGDGRLDLATVEITYGGGFYSPLYAFRLYAGTAQGFTAAPIQSTQADLTRAVLAAGDFDGDGMDDLATCTEVFGSNDARCSLHRGQAAGPLLLKATWNLGPVWSPTPAMGDMNGDGKDEVVLCSSSVAVPLEIVYGTAGAIQAPVIVPLPVGEDDNGARVVGDDLDGDGFGDLASGLLSQATLIVAGGAAGPGAVQVVPAFVSSSTHDLEMMGDVDGDGLGDLLAGWSSLNGYEGEVAVFRSGTIAPADPGPYVTHGGADQEAGFAITSGDFDGNGHADRVFLGWSGQLQLRVYVGIEYGP